jgi:hypothetical protein
MTAAIARQNWVYARTAMFAILVFQIAFISSVMFTRAMLNADGAYFVFVIGAGAPWELKWADLPTRVSTYLFTVIPTELIAHWLALTGSEVAAVNGLVFYGFQLAQLVVVVLLAGRRFASLLIFPVAQYALSNALGIGFPSEALLAPGFFWICIFCLMHRPLPKTIFGLSFLSLMFSHEIAIPAAMFVVFWALRAGDGVSKADRFATTIICCVCGAAWVAVRFSGVHQADYTALYVLDPRRFLYDPTLWMIGTAAVAIAVCAWKWDIRASYHIHVPLALGCLALPLMLWPFVNFGQGRYETGRTLIGVTLPVLGLAMMLATNSARLASEAAKHQRIASAFALVITVALALNFSATAVFLWDWNRATNALENFVGERKADEPIRTLTLAEFAHEAGDGAGAAMMRTGYPWSWPYRSAILADHYNPQRMIYDPEQLVCAEHLEAANGGAVPLETRVKITELTCVPPQPRPMTLREKIMKRLGFP